MIRSENNASKVPLDVLNIFLLSLCSLLISIQLLVILGFISNLYPPESPIIDIVLQEIKSSIRMERELLLFRAFVITLIALQGCALFIFKSRLNDKNFHLQCRQFLLTQLFFVSLLLTLLFKIAVHGEHNTLKTFAYIVFGASMTVGLLWYKIPALAANIKDGLFRSDVMHIIRLITDISVPIALTLIFFIPNTSDVVAKLLTIDRLNHFDTFLGAPGWAVASGGKLNIDIFSQYGLGMPLLLSKAISLFGDFNYEKILSAFVIVAILYYMIYYFFLRLWLKSTAFALIGLMLAMNLHMFSSDPSTFFAWKHPSISVVRYFFDVPFFILLLLHNRNIDKKIYLYCVAVLNSFALFYILDSGVYLLITAYSYYAMTLILPGYREKMYKSVWDFFHLIPWIFLPIILFFMYAWLYAGQAALMPNFWLNFKEYVDIAMGGFDGLPVSWGLTQGMFISFALGVGMLLTYLIAISATGSLLLMRKIDIKYALLIPLSVYGFCLYHYFVFRSSPLAFYVIAMPAVTIIIFFVSCWVNTLHQERRRNITALVMIISLFIFFTSPALMRYPHIFNKGVDQFAAERENYKLELDISKDVALIKAYTHEHEKVPLFSSFEVAILMKANRRPFFYYFPFANSRSLQSMDYGGTKVYTTKQLKRIINQMVYQRPKHVFIDSKLFYRKLPVLYYKYYQSLNLMVKYLNEKYTPVSEGKHLVVLKRK